MREISTKPIEVGEHVMIDGVEYVAERPDLKDVCKGCAFSDNEPCSDFIECHGIIFKKVKKEPKWRPYNDTDEMIADWEERVKKNLSETLIWVKNEWGNRYVLTGFSNDAVVLAGGSHKMQSIYRFYTYLDGSPCGKEVTE